MLRRNVRKIIAITAVFLLMFSFTGSVRGDQLMITSWSNSVTYDDSTDISANVDETITFNVTANRENVTWNWMIGGENQGVNESSFSCSFERFGKYNVSVYGTEGEGNDTTQKLRWDITSFLKITDDLGYTINISEKPQRIVSLSPSNTEILFSLGLDDSIVGVTTYCDYPVEAQDKEEVGSYTNPNVEKIIVLDPDLILASHGTEIDVLNQLKSLNFTVFGLNPLSLEEVVTSINTVGVITQAEENASLITEDMNQRIDSIGDVTSFLSDTQRLNVLYVIWYDPLFVAGSETYANDLILKAGGINIASELSGWQVMNLESVLVKNPQVIICSGMGGASYTIRDEIMNDSTLMKTDAVKYGRVYPIDDPNTIERAGPRIVEGLETVHEMIEVILIQEGGQKIDLKAGKTARISGENFDDVVIDLAVSSNITTSFNLEAFNTLPPEIESIDIPSLGKYVKIDSENLDDLMDWSILSFFFTKEEFDNANLKEDSLSLCYYNDTSKKWDVIDSDVIMDDVEGYKGHVKAKIPHFGIFGITGEPKESGESHSSGGGSSGGGSYIPASSPSPSPTPSHVPTLLSFEFEEEISEIVVNCSGNVSNVSGILDNASITVKNIQEIDGLNVTNITDLCYAYYNITAENITGLNITNATIFFKVNRSWIASNDINESSIRMCRYEDGNWTYLLTSKIGEDNESLYFSANTPGFSIFAITGSKDLVLEKQVILESNETMAIETPLPTTKNETNETGGLTDELIGENTTEVINYFVLMPAVIFSFAMVVVITIIYFRRRRKDA